MKFFIKVLNRHLCFQGFLPLALLIFFPLFLAAQNWLYLAPGAPKKWVNLGDLDVSGDQLTVEALITGIPGGSTLNILSKHTDPTNVNYLLRPKEFLITTSNGFFFVTNPKFSSPQTLPLNTAFHVAATYNGSELRFYVNGCLVNTAACTGTMVLNDFNTAIGNQSTINEAFTGYLDEVRIWNVARSQAEIQANMNTLPNPTTQTGLVAYYNFDSDYTNIQGNATWNGTPVGPPSRTSNPFWSGGINNLSVTAIPADNACFNDTSGSITASATGAFSPYSFSLDGLTYQSSSIFSGLTSGNYVVYAQTNASCIDTTTVFINQPLPISINASQLFAPCDSFATAVAVASGGTGPSYTFQWNSVPVQIADTATGLTESAYTVYATDANNCTDSGTVTISITDPITVATYTVFPPCPGECNGMTAAVGSGGSGSLSYLWENGQTLPVTSGLCADTINITVSDINGCAFSDTILLQEAEPLLTTVSSTNSNCGQPDGSAQVTAISGGAIPGTYSYLWDSLAFNQATPTATGLTDGIYSVTVSSGACDTVISATVGYNPPPTASAIGDSALCYGECNGTGLITASGGPAPGTFFYLWDNGETTQAASALCMGIHSVTATDSTGCSATATITIGQPDSLISNVTLSYFPCDSFATATVTSSGGTGAFFYQWTTTPAQSQATATALISGTYFVFTNDENACSDTDSVTVLITQPLVLNFAVVDPPCPGECNGSAVASGTGGNPPLTYLWESGQNTQAASGLCNDTFNVSVTDTNGCVFSDTIIMQEAEPISMTVLAINSNCGQPDGSASLSNFTGGGIPGTYSLLWDSAAGSQTTSTATGLISGNYYVTVTSGFCDTTVAVSVGNNDPPTANATGDSVRCFGECNGSGLVIASGGPAPGTYSYLWDNGEMAQVAVSLCAGTHTVTVTDSVGCTTTASLEIYQPDLLIATIDGDGDTTICVSGSATVSAFAAGGTLPYTFSWSNGWIGSGPHSDNPADTTCYLVSVTDAKGCDTASSNYCVDIFPPLQVSSTSSDTICEGNTVQIGAAATGGHPDSIIVYSWETGIDDTISVTPNTYPLADYFTVTVSDGCSPNATATISINFFITPAVSFTSDTNAGCMPLTVNFENTTPNIISSQWNFGNGQTSSSVDPQVIFEDTGSYTISLVVISADNCPGDTTVFNYIKVNPLPPADAGNDTTVYQETEVMLQASGGVQYLWNTGETTEAISVIPPSTTIYTVTVTDAAGCVSFGELTITVDFKYVIFVPSMFSPNNDGVNEIVTVQGIGINYFSLQVFNRWGEKVFETSDETIGWDGKFRGMNLNSGVFVYLLEAAMDDGTTIKRSGNITLVR